MVNYFFVFFIIFSFALIFFCKKYNILVDRKIEKHKKYSTKSKSFLIGGVLFVTFLNYYFLKVQQDPLLLIFIISIFLIGFMSDLKQLNSVSLRFFLQCIFVLIFVNFLKIEINYTKINIFDQWLTISLINIIFVTFCLLVLKNGSNFIDGINGITIGYFLIIFLTILTNLSHFEYDKVLLTNLIFVLLILLLLNLYGIIYLGDSGSYSLSLFSGIFLIEFTNTNISISHYFIIVLLWYPCFELLFTIIRRLFQKNQTYKPDTIHLHQLIYKKIKTNFDIKNDPIIHLITMIIINLYNLMCFFISTKYIYFSEILIIIFTFNILVYIVLYNLLKRN